MLYGNDFGVKIYIIVSRKPGVEKLIFDIVLKEAHLLMLSHIREEGLT